MAKIKVTNPKQIINGGAKKYYFKVKGVGGIKGDKGDKGDTGSQGPQGPQGNAATIMVGSTTTLPTGYDATVTNTGTINNAILNFGIPRGIKGDTGAKGDKGDKGDKGEQGNTGPQGPAGQNATVYIGTTTTGAPGTQASVYNSGTDRNAVLNFTIPQGAKGDTGATGATGPQGPAGQDGQNFTPTVVDSLPATGDQSKLYLTPKDYTTGTATGNPITISLGEEAGQITSAQLDGDTYQQSYTGKNIFTAGNFDYTNGGIRSIGANGVINSSGTLSQSWGFNIYGGKNLIPSGIIPAGTYTVSINQTVAFPFILGLVAEDNTTTIGNYTIPAGSKSYTFTTDQPAKYFTLWSNYANHSGEQITVTDLAIMIESGSSATAYEPYVGGVPSPNPDYPQQIQTVTGTQTVSINGTDYPISLGSIELCKLGDYQDYIWKDGEDWKVHKATKGIIFDGSLDESWEKQELRYTDGYKITISDIVTATSDTLTATPLVMTAFRDLSPSDVWNTLENNSGVCLVQSSKVVRLTKGEAIGSGSSSGFIEWLGENNQVLYYPLATPTDTTITDQTLITQLEAVRNATLQASNTITNTATGTNLAGDLELGYCEYDPTNRYDKWLWLDLNNNYEKVGEDSSEWLNGTIYNGYKASTNTAYPNGIQYRICGGFLCVRFGVSANSGNLASGEQSVGEIPEELQGHNIKLLSSPDNRTMVRGFLSCGGGISGFFQINKGVIVIAPNSSTGWASGQIQIPLED